MFKLWQRTLCLSCWPDVLGTASVKPCNRYCTLRLWDSPFNVCLIRMSARGGVDLWHLILAQVHDCTAQLVDSSV
eukprot:11875006-Karenia_brevis.AAC.1